GSGSAGSAWPADGAAARPAVTPAACCKKVRRLAVFLGCGSGVLMRRPPSRCERVGRRSIIIGRPRLSTAAPAFVVRTRFHTRTVSEKASPRRLDARSGVTMDRLRILGFAACLLAACAPLAAAGQAPRDHDITVDDYFTQADLFEVAVSPDGGRVAYSEGRWQESTGDRKADLWVVDSK